MEPIKKSPKVEAPFKDWAESIVSSGPKDLRNKMFQFPLWVAKNLNNIGSEEIENKSKKSVYNGDPGNQGSSQKRVPIHCLWRLKVLVKCHA